MSFSFKEKKSRLLSRYFRTGYGRKNQFLELIRNQVWNRVGHVQKSYIFKAGFDFAVIFSPPPPPPENRFRDGIDSHKESMPGVLKSLNIRALLYSSISKDESYILGEYNVLYCGLEK